MQAPRSSFLAAPALPPGWYCPQSAGPSCLCLGWSGMLTISETGILLTSTSSSHKTFAKRSFWTDYGQWKENSQVCNLQEPHFFFLLLKSILPPPHIEFSVPCLEGILQNSRLGVEINIIAGSSRSSEDVRATVWRRVSPSFFSAVSSVPRTALENDGHTVDVGWGLRRWWDGSKQ